MFYRENGQFKTTYRADEQIFPILQDRIAIAVMLAIVFVAVPMLGSDYMFNAILIPFVILSLAAIGVNILVGYCGQLSLGSAAFMGLGAYAAHNAFVRIEGMPLIVALLAGGFFAMLAGLFFGLPSLRIKGMYLAVATLAVQFFSDWMFINIEWFTRGSTVGKFMPGGPVTVFNLQVFGLPINSPVSKYLFCLTVLAVLGLMAKNLVRGAIGREWMAIRDMDLAATVIGIRPVYAKLSAFAVSSFILGIAGVLWAFIYLGTWEPQAFPVTRSFQLLFIVIIGGMGSIMGSVFGAAFVVLLPILLNRLLSAIGTLFGVEIPTTMLAQGELMIFGALIVWFLIVEPKGLAKLWSVGKQKMRLWPFPH